MLAVVIRSARAVARGFERQYRDVRYIVPFLTQFWMFATPVAYRAVLSGRWRVIYGLNPMAGAIEGSADAASHDTPPANVARLRAIAAAILISACFISVAGTIFADQFKSMAHPLLNRRSSKKF